MRTCPTCHHSWPEDRFNPKFPDCFKCRVAGLGVTFGHRGRQAFHSHTIKEFNDRQIREATANGLTPVPANTASNAGPTASALKKLSTVSSFGKRTT